MIQNSKKVVPKTAKVIYAWNKKILSFSKNSKLWKQEIYMIKRFPFIYWHELVARKHFAECDLPNYTIYRICNHISNTTGATCGGGSAYPSGAPEITPSFWWGSCCLFFSFLCCVMFTIVFLFVFFIF